MCRIQMAVLLVGVALSLASCGGGGSSSGGGGATANLSFTVNWGERSRALSGPASGLSLVLRVIGGNVSTGDFIVSVDRDTDTSAHPMIYPTGRRCLIGRFNVSATFYSDLGAQGDVVGIAWGELEVLSDGSLSGTISTTSTIASLVVPSGQSVAVAESRQLDFSARDGLGGIVAVSPGSVAWSVVSGADKLAFLDGYAKGLAVGLASAVATVDGRASAAVNVAVTSTTEINVSISPQAVVLSPGTSRQFTAQVSGTSNTGITWKVVTAAGGSISSNGLFAANGTASDVIVEARSVADPTRSASALVTVRSERLIFDSIFQNEIQSAPGVAWALKVRNTNSSEIVIERAEFFGSLNNATDDVNFFLTDSLGHVLSATTVTVDNSGNTNGPFGAAVDWRLQAGAIYYIGAATRNGNATFGWGLISTTQSGLQNLGSGRFIGFTNPSYAGDSSPFMSWRLFGTVSAP